MSATRQWRQEAWERRGEEKRGGAWIELSEGVGNDDETGNDDEEEDDDN